MQQQFKTFDTTSSGFLSIATLESLLIKLSLYPTAKQLISMKKKIDPQKSGRFSLNSFASLALELAKSEEGVDCQKQMLKVFMALDQENSGLISQTQFKKIMRLFDSTITQEQLKQMYRCGKARDGKINYRQLIKTILKFE